MKPIYLIDGARSPFLKARGAPGPFSASDLAVQTGRALLLRQPFAPTDLSEVIVGCAVPSPDETNIGRVISLRLGCGNGVIAHTVMRNCASGMQAIDTAMANIETGRSELVLAGGVDALSRAPLLFSDGFVRWLSRWYAAKSLPAKLRLLAQIQLKDLAPVIGLLKGLTDPVVGLSMGQTAENLAYRFGITRVEMDAFAQTSHQAAAAYTKTSPDAQIIPLFDSKGKVYASDDGVRADVSLEKLATLKAVFDRPHGQITAGNSSQVSDGAAFVILASETALSRYDLTPIAKINDVQWAGLAPEHMGLGPVYAASKILTRQALHLNDLAGWEINEAFAAQVLACQAAWCDEDFCRKELDLPNALGAINPLKLNPHGGAIALGHPVGASGARIVLKLCASLKSGERGMAAICIGGGQGGAMLIEKL